MLIIYPLAFTVDAQVSMHVPPSSVVHSLGHFAAKAGERPCLCNKYSSREVYVIFPKLVVANKKPVWNLCHLRTLLLLDVFCVWYTTEQLEMSNVKLVHF